MFAHGKPFQTSIMFMSKAMSLAKSGHLKGASLGYAPTLLTNIRVG